jgi:hypothetical protein
VGIRYPTGLGDLISLGPPEMLQEECQTSKNRTRTQVIGGQEDLLHRWVNIWISPKMAPALQLKALGFLSHRMQKQASQKDKSKCGS